MRSIHTLGAQVLLAAGAACGSDQKVDRAPMNVVVIDERTGQGLADAYVLASSFTPRSIWIFYRPPATSAHALFKTGSDGTLILPTEVSSREYLSLTVWKPGYRYVWLSHIRLAAGERFVVTSDPVRYAALGESASIVKLKAVDTAYVAQDRRDAVEHLDNALKRLASDPVLVRWQQGVTVRELRTILADERSRLR